MGLFNFDLTLSKAYEDEQKRKHVVGICSDTMPDLQDDRMSKVCIEEMAKQLKDGIDFLDNHRSTFGFGKTADGMVCQRDSDYELSVDVLLNEEYPQSKELYEEVKNGKCDRQMSIGGEIDFSKPDSVLWETTKSGKQTRVINHIKLDHIAATRKNRAANPRARFLAAVVKTLDDDDVKKSIEKTNPAPATIVKDVVVPETKQEKTVAQPEKTIMYKCPECGTESTQEESLKKDFYCKGCFSTPEEIAFLSKQANGKVVPFKSFPLVDRKKEANWTFNTAEGNAILEKGWDTFKSVNTYFDPTVGGKHNTSEWKSPNVPEVKEAYKLPHHKLDSNGNMKTYFRGVAAAARSVIPGGGRTVDVESDMRAPLLAHLSRHYREFGVTPPTLKEFMAFSSEDEYIIWMSKNAGIDISFIKEITDEAIVNVCDKGGIKIDTDKEKDINTALEFFSVVGKKLNEKSIIVTRENMSEIIKPAEVVKTEVNPAEVVKTVQPEVIPAATIAKTEIKPETKTAVTEESILKTFDEAMVGLRSANMSSTLMEKMRKYFDAFRLFLSENKIITETPVQQTPDVSAMIKKEMQDGFAMFAKQLKESVGSDILEKGIEASINKAFSANAATIAKTVNGIETRIEQLEKVGGIRQSVPANPPSTEQVKNPDNPFAGIFSPAFVKAGRKL